MLVQVLEQMEEVLQLMLKKIIGLDKVKELNFDIEVDEESLAGILNYVKSKL